MRSPTCSTVMLRMHTRPSRIAHLAREKMRGRDKLQFECINGFIYPKLHRHNGDFCSLLVSHYTLCISSLSVRTHAQHALHIQHPCAALHGPCMRAPLAFIGSNDIVSRLAVNTSVRSICIACKRTGVASVIKLSRNMGRRMLRAVPRTPDISTPNEMHF